MKCRFDKSKNFIRAYALYLKYKCNKEIYEPNEEFLQALDNAFDNPEIAAEAVREHVGAKTIAPTGSPVQVKNIELTGNYRRNEDSDNINSYYLGDSGYRRMVSKFRKDILGAAILSIDLNTGKFNFFDSNKIVNPNLNITQLQSNLLQYKQKLLNDLLKAIDPNAQEISLSENMDDYSFTKTVDDIIAMFEETLNDDNKGVLESNGYYDSYVILKNFDRLIEKFASYVTIDESYRKSRWEGVRKYALTPKVKHYSGFSTDEGADVSKQISDLAESVLKLIPEVDVKGNIIENSMVGVDGFNGSMMTLKQALLYSQNLGNNSAYYRTLYSQGADALINSFQQIIDDFINNNSKPREGVGAYNDYRQTYIHNKLRGISRYLMSKDTPADIRNMFAQMFIKTEPTTYRVYGIDRNSEDNKFVGKDLKSRMTVTQKRAFETVIKSGLDLIQSGSRRRASDLSKKYNISIKSNGGDSETAIITNNENGNKIHVSYTVSNNKLKTISINEIDSSIMEDLMYDVFSYIIPDTYATCLSDENYDWQSDFTPFIILAAKEIQNKLKNNSGLNININDENGIKLTNFNSLLLNIGQRLGVIYGDSIHNTVRNLSGNNLPLFQLTSLEYNWRMCLDDAKKDEFSPIQHTLFWDNEDLLTIPQRRSDIEFRGIIKSPAKLNLEELLKLSIIDDFLFPFLDSGSNADAAIYFQNTTFSDKTTHFLPGFKLLTELKGDDVQELFGHLVGGINLKNIITDALEHGTKNIIELGRRMQMKQTGSILDNILRDYETVFGWGLVPTPGLEDEAYLKDVLKKAKALDQKLKTFGISYIRNAFNAKHVIFKEEIHATEPKAKGLGKTRLNETMLAIFEASTDPKLWELRTHKDRVTFAKDLSRTKLYGFTSGMDNQIKEIQERTKDFFNDSEYYDPILREYSFVSKDGTTLNPIAEVYFALDQILSNQFNSLTVGDFWAHANKNKDTSDYLTYSEANRFVNQIKRNVIFGSTIHPFAQGIKDDNGYEIGVTSEINIAIIKDQEGLFYTPAGVDSKGDAQDGCGWCTGLQSILENNSLIDAKVGDNKKTILHDIDHRYGAPTLLKWAVYSLTNSVRRNGKQSKASVENLVYKMYNVRFDGFDGDLNSDYQAFKTKNGPIYVYDLKTATYREIVGISRTADGLYSTIYVDSNGNRSTGKPIRVNTLYAIDQLFGGAWTFDKNSDGTYSGNEASSYILADIACKYNLRDKQVAYAVNASGCKVGATNINDKEAWENLDALRTYKVSTKYAGAMMNADHELDMAEVTEMSQMISALIENGFYTDIVTNIYKEIGEIALNNAKTQKYIKAVEAQDRSKIAELLGQSLIASFKSGNKDTIGLAQAFIKKFDTEFKKAKIAGTVSTYTIPFSDPTIFGAFVSDITSRFNKDAIRRKYEGFAGIMNPSYNMIQYYRNADNEVKLFQQFNEECREKLEPIVGTLPDEYTDWVEIAQDITLYNLSSGDFSPKWNPFVVPITKEQIDFEDTIVLMHPDGELGEIIYIDTQEKYDRVKHLMDLTDYKIFNHTARPKNLRGVNTTFTINAVNILGETGEIGTYSLYDIDSVRAALYLQQGIKEDDPYREQKLALIEKVCAGIEESRRLNYCNSLTQDFLKKLDLGKEFVSSLNRGETPDFSNISLNHNECFGFPIDGVTYYASNYETRPAEIIIGRYQFDKLGLTDQDHIWQIKDYHYFYEKLKNSFPEPLISVNSAVRAKAYDRVLYHKGQPFLVKVGNVTHGEDGLKENKCLQNNIVGDDLRWESEVILTNESDDENYFDKFKFTYIEDENHQRYPVITVQSWDDLEEISHSDFFEDFYRKNASGRRSDEIQAEEEQRLIRLAETKYEAFKEALKFVGARIPTQAMQSFIPANVIAVTDSKLNATYFPVSGMFIEGADLDGDKIFLLTCTLLNNGSIQSGSALQKELGYKTTSRLLKGKNTTFEEGSNGYPIDGNQLAQFLVPTYEWDDATRDNFVYFANTLIEGSLREGYTQINFIKPDNVDDELFNKQKKKFLDLLNTHSKTKSYIRDSIETLKSRVFNGIRQVTLGAQCQMKSQITVDSCTEKFKDAARDTQGGKIEKTISPRVPSSKYQMQVQGILGKSVVGIGAVSLKTYFILSTAYNRKVDDIVRYLNSGQFDKATNLLNSIKIVNPFTQELCTLANTNLEKILDLEDTINWPNKNEFFDLVRTLARNTSLVSAPEDLSAIISLSADNMKDLALPKLNATENLVDIYTTAFMLGIPFSEISRIMTSPVFTMLTEAGKNNIFDAYTDGLRVKDLIGEFLLNTDDAKSKISSISSLFTDATGSSLSKDWMHNLKTIEELIDLFIRPGGIIDNHNDTVKINDGDIEYDDNGVPININTTLKIDAYNLYRYLLFLRDRIKILRSNNNLYRDIQKLSNLLPYVESMSTLGQQASINQGLKTNIHEFFKFSENIQDFVNRRLPEEYERFSFERFLMEDDYRDFWISKGAEVIPGFNILEALSLSPNFFSMSKIVPYVKYLLESSQSFTVATNAARSFKADWHYFTENDFNECLRYIQDLRIFNFLSHSDFTLNLDEVARLTGKDLEVYMTAKSLDRTSITDLRLDSGLNLASFKRIMETSIIPYLKEKYKDNSFITDLLPKSNSITGITAYALPIPMMNIDRDEGLSSRYAKYLRDFNNIANDGFAGIKLGDLFFIYNLLVNKNQFGQNSFTRIFEELINTKDVPKYISQYYAYDASTELDRNIEHFNKEHLKYRLKKYSKGTKVKYEGIIHTMPKDTTLDLPFLFEGRNLLDPTRNEYRWSPVENLTPGDIIETLVNSLNKTGQKISIVTNEDVERHHLPKERGFIMNGVICINKDSFNDTSSLLGVAVHELSHAILAAIKTSNDDIRQRYYALLNQLKNDPDFDTIARLYPDRVGSDLLEEVFCNKLEKILTNTINQNSKIEVAIVGEDLLLQGLRNLFKNDNMVLQDGLFKPLTNLLDFATTMFDFSNEITSDFTRASQQMAALKTRLFNSKNDDFKLDQICK